MKTKLRPTTSEGLSEQDIKNTLSLRELQTFLALALGATNPEIAGQLGCAVKTVDTHRGHVISKLCLRHNVDIARLALRAEMVTLDDRLEDRKEQLGAWHRIKKLSEKLGE